jgi:hypothetical protein
MKTHIGSQVKTLPIKMPLLSKQHHYHLLIIISSVSCIYKINYSPKKVEDKKLKIKISPAKLS